MKIGILFGGNSLEHEISIITAYQLKNKLKDKYDIIMLYMDFNSNIYIADKVSIKDFKNSTLKKLKKTRLENGGIEKVKIDSIIIANHGENGEDGISAALCEFYNIPYVGASIFAGSLSIDKWLTYNYLSNCGIPMLKTKIYTYDDYLSGKEIEEYPIIIKPVKGGSSLGIFTCDNKDDLDDKLVKAFGYSKELIIQRYYPNIKEYNMAVYSNGYSNLEEIKSKSDIFSFNNKYNESFKQFHQRLVDNRIDDFKEICRNVYNLINAKGIIRLDFFMLDDKIYVNEVNTTPGALSMYLIDDFIKVIDDEIKLSIINKKPIYTKGNFLSSTEINK